MTLAPQVREGCSPGVVQSLVHAMERAYRQRRRGLPPYFNIIPLARAHLTRDQLLPSSTECTTVSIGNSGSGSKKVQRLRSLRFLLCFRPINFAAAGLRGQEVPLPCQAEQGQLAGLGHVRRRFHHRGRQGDVMRRAAAAWSAR